MNRFLFSAVRLKQGPPLRLWPLFIAVFCFVVSTVILTARPASAQSKLTYTLPKGSRYFVEQDEGFPFQTNADGTVTVRVRVTFRFLAPPPAECYPHSDEPDEYLSPESGLLGTELGFISQSRPLKDDEIDTEKKTGEIIASPDVLKENLQKSGIRLSTDVLTTKIDLFNRLRTLASRVEQDNLRNRAVPPAQADKITIADKDAASAYGDWLANSRSARSLAWHGPANLDLQEQRNVLNALDKTKTLKLLRDPNSIREPKPEFAGLSDTNFQKYGRWYFELYNVNSNTAGITNLFGVKVVWAFETTFDPKKRPEFPLFTKVNVESKKAPEEKSPSNQPATTSGSAGAVASEGGANGITPLITGFSLAGVGNQPGVDLVAGFAILNNGTPSFAGLNLRKSSGKLKGGLFDQSRLGALVGQTLGSGKKSVLLAPSAAINDNAVLFAGFSLAGGAYSDSNHTTRQSVAFGAAIRIGISGVTKDEKDKKDEELRLSDIVFDNQTPAYREPCVSNDYAVVLVTSDAPATFTYRVRDPKKPETDTPQETIQLNREPTPERNYWLFYVQPGELVLGTDKQAVITEVGKTMPLNAQHPTLQKGRAYVVRIVPDTLPKSTQPQIQTFL